MRSDYHCNGQGSFSLLILLLFCHYSFPHRYQGQHSELEGQQMEKLSKRQPVRASSCWPVGFWAGVRIMSEDPEKPYISPETETLYKKGLAFLLYLKMIWLLFPENHQRCYEFCPRNCPEKRRKGIHERMRIPFFSSSYTTVPNFFNKLLICSMNKFLAKIYIDLFYFSWEACITRSRLAYKP